ncbi:MAG: ABC transporter permease, partial [Calditrichaeota bacterium]|nr:ABC transporter permease [Calditrichota bacterium]
MFKNYLKIAWRNVARDKTYSIINILGLAIGLACTILILMWVRDEVNFDSFHQNRNEIYRIVQDTKKGDDHATTVGLLPAELKKQLPEVINTARIFSRSRILIRYNDKTFYETGGIRADPALFEIFDFPFIKGVPESLKDGIIITESMARKYFGDEEPVGKTLSVDSGYGFIGIMVSGVLKDIPENSHLQ